MKQKDIFLESEGDRWLERNRSAMASTAEDGDPVITAIDTCGIRPKRVLEIGCSLGWRLSLMRERYGCEIMGVDPSREACIEAAARRVPAVQSTASSPAVSSQFDLVIYGFCLYVTDPDDWLQIAAAGNCLLSPGGHLLIYDFAATATPHARHYGHRDGVLSYHFDFANLWLGSPLYTMSMRAIQGSISMITILKKRPVSSIEVLP